MKITVCGAGPGGIGVAFFLKAKGHEVTLYDMPAFADRIEPFRENRHIVVSGEATFDGELDRVCFTPEEALEGAQVVVVVMHAGGHEPLARLVAGIMKPDQLLVMCPGYIGGGKAFLDVLQGIGAPLPPYIEASSLMLTVRPDGPHRMHLPGRKKGFFLYVPQELDDHPFVKSFLDMFAPVRLTRHPLEPGLNEINIVVHAVLTLLNVEKLEQGEPWLFYRQGFSPAIARLVECVDAERCQVQQALGLTPHTFEDLLVEFYSDYGLKGKDLYEKITTYENLANVKGATSFDNRFLTEDLPFGIAPITQLGRELGLEMPYMTMVLQLAKGLTGIDFLETGRKVSTK